MDGCRGACHCGGGAVGLRRARARLPDDRPARRPGAAGRPGRAGAPAPPPAPPPPGPLPGRLSAARSPALPPPAALPAPEPLPDRLFADRFPDLPPPPAEEPGIDPRRLIGLSFAQMAGLLGPPTT